ncbi:MAG: SET domain-containing protein [Planctomycetota bacterium]|nr:SET domain-containing protein [Planctomycetota bacterium]
MITVQRNSYGVHVVATRTIAKDELIIRVDPMAPTTANRDRYSIQVGENKHTVAVPDPVTGKPPMWRSLNHSCRPTATWKSGSLVAIATIKEGDEVTFNYLTTEWVMAEPFACRCGCGGRMVSGYRDATEEQRAEVEHLLAPHIQQLRASVAVV